jgi:hypothetical protein
MGKKINKAEILPVIAEIREHNETIKALIENLPDSSMKKAFESSYNNLDNKCEIYSAPSLTSEERKVAREAAKKALADFRAGREGSEEDFVNSPNRKSGKKH